MTIASPHVSDPNLTEIRRAERVIPGGASAGGRNVPGLVVERASGAHLWTADGRRLVDHLCSYGPIVLGHCHPGVNEAVTTAMQTVDLTWVGPQAGEVELAETIVTLVPSAEKVAFFNTGTDALQHALYVARVATGRRKVVKFHGHYHGWAGALGTGANFDVEPGRPPARSAPNSGGEDPRSAEDVIVLDWNDAQAVSDAFGRHGGEIAAVFTEPYLHSYTNAAPAPGFLELLRAAADDSGSVLVFDEVKTGFRHHLGGYQAIAGVVPDLTALGKAMANGFTIAALAGRSDLMDELGDRVTMDGTYYANPYAIAAARATIAALGAGAVDRLHELGGRLREGLDRAIRDTGVVANVTGIGSGWIINWRADPPVTFSQAVDADVVRAEEFRRLMLDAGILLAPYPITDNRFSAATSIDDIEETVEAARRAMQRVR